MERALSLSRAGRVGFCDLDEKTRERERKDANSFSPLVSVDVDGMFKKCSPFYLSLSFSLSL